MTKAKMAASRGKKETNLLQEIATRDNFIFGFQNFSYLPNPDPVLKRMGRDITAYTDIMSDAYVAGAIRRRKASVKSLEWKITQKGGVKKQLKMIDAIFHKLPLQKIITEILDATLFGYQVLEVIWEYKDGYIVPKDVLGKPQSWFVFDDDNQLKFLTKQNFLGELVPDKKFLLATQNATYINPYGVGDLSTCYWAATFKKGGFKYWLEFIEKYGSPWVVGKYSRDTDPDEVEELLDSLEAAKSNAVIAVADDAEVQFQDPTGRGDSSDAFEAFQKACKAEISVALLGQNQTTESEANRASATAGLEVTEDIRDDHAQIVEHVFNTLIRWVCEINFNSSNEHPTFELFEQETIDKVQAERDGILSKVGVKFTKSYFMNTYSLQETDIEDNLQIETDKASQVEDFSELELTPIQDIADELAGECQEQTDVWIDDMKTLLESAQSLDEYRDMLDQFADKLSIAEYSEALSQATITANLSGRSQVQDEVKNV